MKVLELFAGTKSIGKVASSKGHYVFSVDNNAVFNCDMTANILEISSEDIHFSPDVIWASPPCTTFSVASIGCHWKGGKGAYVPKTEKCRIGLRLLAKTVRIISELNPTVWFIENPRGVMRKVIDDIFQEYGVSDYIRHTVTYCQYGDSRMKPTDIWTNSKTWVPRPMCKNGSPCHEAAPRGSRTGTQGLKGNMERSIIPVDLCQEIITSLGT